MRHQMGSVFPVRMAVFAIWIATLILTVTASSAEQIEIRVDFSRRLQRIDGFGSGAFGGFTLFERGYCDSGFVKGVTYKTTPQQRRAMITTAVKDLGMTHLRVWLCPSGIEQTNDNDDPAVMKTLMLELLKIRVRPYYIYQCDPIVGSRHFRTSVLTGIKIIEHLRGFTTGYAVPTFVIDAPGGGGKIPIGPDYIVSQENGKYVLRNYAGEQYGYDDVE